MFCANLCKTLNREELSKDWGEVLSAFARKKPKDKAAHNLVHKMVQELGPPFDRDVDCDRQCAMGLRMMASIPACMRRPVADAFCAVPEAVAAEAKYVLGACEPVPANRGLTSEPARPYDDMCSLAAKMMEHPRNCRAYVREAFRFADSLAKEPTAARMRE